VIGAVGLAGNERRYPRQLSQGMRQRANLARLLAIEPQLFLMDEPFSALDAQTKHALQREFAKIHDRSPRSVVYVTHDLAEAALLADRIVVMSRGRIARDITVPFSRPRDLDDLRFDEDFGAFTRELWTLLSDLEGRPL
jgi:NitT/TauT family transport system ATP-binding protein